MEKLSRFEYAKCLVEIGPDRELPDLILCGDNNSRAEIGYDWKPTIYTVCKRFDHQTVS